ncbi:peptidyl-prolyl cis-trans isomerase [Klebsiella pneumoniae]|nr:peptidyl-prolyl cis-trans isomerase [Klebsiella pneumoniae]
MNRAATLTLNAPLLMLVAALALSTPFTAGAAPAFLDYAQQQTQQSQAQEKNDAASAKQTQESGNDSNLLIVFYVQIMPDDFVMQLHRF